MESLKEGELGEEDEAAEGPLWEAGWIHRDL